MPSSPKEPPFLHLGVNRPNEQIYIGHAHGSRALMSSSAASKHGRMASTPVNTTRVLSPPKNACVERSSKCTIVHFKNFFLGADDQFLINAHFAKFVLDHGNALAVVFVQNVIR